MSLTTSMDGYGMSWFSFMRDSIPHDFSILGRVATLDFLTETVTFNAVMHILVNDDPVVDWDLFQQQDAAGAAHPTRESEFTRNTRVKGMRYKALGAHDDYEMTRFMVDSLSLFGCALVLVCLVCLCGPFLLFFNRLQVFLPCCADKSPVCW